jgi:cysteine desulfurase
MIYWDHNSTSPLRPRVKERMIEAIESYHANASSAHTLGQKCRVAIENVRKNLADVLVVDPSEIVFTASATESNLMSLWGLWFSRSKANPKHKKILTSSIEHNSVYENIMFLKERFGAEVELLPVSKSGIVDLTVLEEKLKDPSIAFVSCIGAHNELGVIQPWEQMAEMCAARQIPFHVDLVQCLMRQPLNLSQSKVSLATLCFHKSGGPKGVGLLYWRSQLPLESVIRGGSQEKKRRAGTENIVAIMGAGALVEEASTLYSAYEKEIRPVRDFFETELLNRGIPAQIVGAAAKRLPNTSYVIFDGSKSDVTLMKLDMAGICASSGAACSSGMVIPSRALLNLGYSETEATSAVRFSLGQGNSKAEAEKVLETLQKSFSRKVA